jgi:hypothetical protein
MSVSTAPECPSRAFEFREDPCVPAAGAHTSAGDVVEEILASIRVFRLILKIDTTSGWVREQQSHREYPTGTLGAGNACLSARGTLRAGWTSIFVVEGPVVSMDGPVPK